VCVCVCFCLSLSFRVMNDPDYTYCLSIHLFIQAISVEDYNAMSSVQSGNK